MLKLQSLLANVHNFYFVVVQTVSAYLVPFQSLLLLGLFNLDLVRPC